MLSLGSLYLQASSSVFNLNFEFLKKNVTFLFHNVFERYQVIEYFYSPNSSEYPCEGKVTEQTDDFQSTNDRSFWYINGC